MVCEAFQGPLHIFLLLVSPHDPRCGCRQQLGLGKCTRAKHRQHAPVGSQPSNPQHGLQAAAEARRLDRDTYKRLNLGLVSSAVLLLIFTWKMPNILSQAYQRWARQLFQPRANCMLQASCWIVGALHAGIGQRHHWALQVTTNKDSIWICAVQGPEAWLLWQVLVASAVGRCAMMLRPYVYWATSVAPSGMGMHGPFSSVLAGFSAVRLADLLLQVLAPDTAHSIDILLQVLPLAQSTASGACQCAHAPPFSTS